MSFQRGILATAPPRRPELNNLPVCGIHGRQHLMNSDVEDP
jgi:hypothetical protein